MCPVTQKHLQVGEFVDFEVRLSSKKPSHTHFVRRCITHKEFDPILEVLEQRLVRLRRDF
jgi:hypothetical protein